MLPGMSQAAVTPKGRVLRHPGVLQWLERRRLQAADLFAQGKTRAEVAAELGVSAQTASRWYVRWRDGGAAGMRTARHGKPARLGPAELGGGRQGGAGKKKTPKARGACLFFREGGGEKPPPPVRRTWAPKGRTPVLRHR